MATSATTFSRKPDLLERFKLRSPSTIHNWVRDGLLPRPVRLGPNVSAWPNAELEAIAAARVAGKGDGEIRELVTRLEAQRLQAA